MKEEDFAAYLGSGSEGEEPEEDASAHASKLREALLGGVGTSVFAKQKSAAIGDDARDGDMIATFDDRLTQKLEARARGQSEKPTTVWDAYLEKKRERGKVRRMHCTALYSIPLTLFVTRSANRFRKRPRQLERTWASMTRFSCRRVAWRGRCALR